MASPSAMQRTLMAALGIRRAAKGVQSGSGVAGLVKSKVRDAGSWQPPPRALDEATKAELHVGTSTLRSFDRAMEDAVVGHRDARLAVILALAAREHVYLEGPPGIAKSMLAKAASRVSGLPCYDTQLHRDTRISDLVGHPMLHRSLLSPGSAESLRLTYSRGGLLDSGVAVLDDVSRAPGEALNVLLRLLAEREWQGTRLPLVSAIATGNPTEVEQGYANESLDPAILDRFLFQMRMDGVLRKGFESECWKLLGSSDDPPSAVGGLDQVHTALPHVLVPAHVKNLLLQILLRVSAAVRRHAPGPGGRPWVGLTDRSFLVRTPRILRAHALFNGRDQCTPADLFVLRLLTAFRLPPDIDIEDTVQDVLDEDQARRDEEQQKREEGGKDGQKGGADKSSSESNLDDDDDWDLGEQGGSDGRGDEQAGGQRQQSQSQGDQAGQGGGGKKGNEQQSDSGGGFGSGEGQTSSDGSEAEPLPDGSQARRRAQDSGDSGTPRSDSEMDWMDQLQEDMRNLPPTSAQRKASEWGQDLPECSHLNLASAALTKQTLADVARLMACLAGRFQKADARREDERSGGPRRWRRMRGFDELPDADACELAEWIRDPGQAWPRTAERKRRQGGAVVVLRDISYSMRGQRAQWAGAVVEGVVEVAEKRAMRIGYAEFSDTPRRWAGGADGCFLTRDYDGMRKVVARSRQEGLTNYQRGIRACLKELAEVPGVKRHVLFLTDGEPTAGCKRLHAERALARRWGVQVHTIYIGNPESEPPPVLTQLAHETGGARFRALHSSGDQIRVAAV
eukprot:TRINITY_DN26159_c0_g1_i1.p1 TRINITY_DN26159_c0_g1~~TRINITY_DN26159_c0_g1_i1.p1  ORF type:complete len:811 (+),score=288.61 TRINITY_DN26159_c0_g1_i1:54-2435(+)